MVVNKLVNTASMLAIALAVTQLVACGGSNGDTAATPKATAQTIDQAFTANATTAKASVEKALTTNADIAFAAYGDVVTTAIELKTAIANFKTSKTQVDFDLVKTAWLTSREPYGQTEVYRFRSSPIDDDPTTAAVDDGPEGSLNAWPLGEALIDSVTTSANISSDFTDAQTAVPGDAVKTLIAPDAYPAKNIISSTVTIDSALLGKTASASDGDERDVIAGYHAIEFLLWGQDLNLAAPVADTKNETREQAALNQTGGHRPLTDYDDGSTAAGRRFTYLEVAVDKLIAELTSVRDQWAPNVTNNYRAKFIAVVDLADAKKKVTQILTGMGTLSEGELAGERMQIAFVGNSQEDEHSCFSDNTHRDIWLNAEGVSNSYYGDYAGYDSNQDGTDDKGTIVNGYGLDDLLSDLSQTTLKTEIEAALTATETAYKEIDNEARTNNTPFDRLIQSNKTATNPVYKTILALNAQSKLIAKTATSIGLTGAVVDPDASGCNTADPAASCP